MAPVRAIAKLRISPNSQHAYGPRSKRVRNANRSGQKRCNYAHLDLGQRIAAIIQEVLGLLGVDFHDADQQVTSCAQRDGHLRLDDVLHLFLFGRMARG